MKKSFHSTLILLAILVGLGAWYFIYEKKLKPQQAEKEEQSKQILTVDRDAIQELTIQQRQGDEKSTKYRTIKFRKAGTDWHVTEPFQDEAESGAVSGLLSSATDAKQDRIVDEKPASLDTFGLTNPKIKITLKKDQASTPQEIWVGSDTPVGSFSYVKVVGKDPIYRGPQTLRTSFDREPGDYRNKRILNINRPDVTEAEIRVGTEAIVLKKGDGDKWLLAREGLPANENEVNKTINSVLEMRATAFAEDKPASLAKWGLAPATATLTLKKKDGQTLIQFGKVKDKFYARRGDKNLVYEIPKDVHEKVSRPAKDYRDLKMATFNRFDIKHIKVEHGTESYDLVKDKSDWKLGSDPAARIDNTKVDDYLTRLQDIKVSGFTSAAHKPKKPDVVIRLYDKKTDKETEVMTLTVGKTSAGATGGRTGLDPAFTISEPDFKKLNAFKQEFLANDKKVENKAGHGKS